jgi:hypothetical protein
MVNSFQALYYYLFDLDNFVLKIIKSNNQFPSRKNKEKNLIIDRLNLMLD